MTFLFIEFLPVAFADLRPLISDLCHLITLSALSSTFGGIVTPICCVTFALITRSNFIGCPTGGWAGYCSPEIFLARSITSGG